MSVRFGPTTWKDKGKAKEITDYREPPRVSTLKEKIPVVVQPTPKSPPLEPKRQINIPPPLNPINRQDGWKELVPSKSKETPPKHHYQDIDMKDDSKNKEKFHIMSKVADNIDSQALFKLPMDKKVQCSVADLLGASPALVKMMNESTCTQRDY
ncbi:hypothetical protein PQX77_005401 [Marasmius sp. AFHP31]|nr:hypothetical protein PQX77_005401 [Marasmius sp. AFHP31]